MFKLFLRLLLPVTLVVGAVACDDDDDSSVTPPEDYAPEAPEPEYGEGHWSVAQRGVAMDADDLAIIGSGPGTGILSPDELTSGFGLLVLNQPYVNWRSTLCPTESQVNQQDLLPRDAAEAFIETLDSQRGVRFDKVAVNVDLLSPGQRALLHICLDSNGDMPPPEGAPVTFSIPEHRREVVAAFRELASMPKIAYITVGLQMNRYYHLKDEDGEGFKDDYSNFITLYREIYATIKEVNPDVQVGPGISWAVFMNQTVPEIASEYGIVETRGALSVYKAYERTVAPLLEHDGASTADYLGVSIIPETAREPFKDNPRSVADEDATDEEQAAVDEHWAEIAEYYLWLPVVAGGRPVALAQMDWPTEGSIDAAKKGPFLQTLKRAMSPVDVSWAAWRRLGDLPVNPPEASPCRKYTEAQAAALRHNISYCFAGMVSENQPRDVLDVIREDP